MGVVNAIDLSLHRLYEGSNSTSLSIVFAPPTKIKNTDKTSINPIWYQSLWHINFVLRWDGSAPLSIIREKVQAVHDAGNILREHIPDGGVYLNEVIFFSLFLPQIDNPS